MDRYCIYRLRTEETLFWTSTRLIATVASLIPGIQVVRTKRFQFQRMPVT